MTDKIVLETVHGTIIEVFECPFYNKNGVEVRKEKGIIIKPDDKTMPIITEAFIGRDYSQFSVGQRVVHVLYTWERPVTKAERIEYAEHDMKCPDEIDEFDYVTYDESSYYQKMQSVKLR